MGNNNQIMQQSVSRKEDTDINLDRKLVNDGGYSTSDSLLNSQSISPKLLQHHQSPPPLLQVIPNQQMHMNLQLPPPNNNQMNSMEMMSLINNGIQPQMIGSPQHGHPNQQRFPMRGG